MGSSSVSERPVQRVMLSGSERKELPEDLNEDQENNDGDDEGEDDDEETAIVGLGKLAVGEYKQRVACA